MIGKGFTDTYVQMPIPSCFFNDSNLKDELEYLGYKDIQGVKPLWMVISFHWKNVSVLHPIIKGSN